MRGWAAPDDQAQWTNHIARERVVRFRHTTSGQAVPLRDRANAPLQQHGRSDEWHIWRRMMDAGLRAEHTEQIVPARPLATVEVAA
jgi:hypothetical protein